MSHDGDKNYQVREYKKETVIKIDEYIDIKNKIIYSFLKERFNNS
jgi:hypothetical protein